MRAPEPCATFQAALLPKLAAALQVLQRSAKRPLDVPAVLVDASRFLGDHAAAMVARAEGASMKLPKDLRQKLAAGFSATESMARAIVDAVLPARRADTSALLGSFDALARGAKPEEGKGPVPESLKGWAGLHRVEVTRAVDGSRREGGSESAMSFLRS